MFSSWIDYGYFFPFIISDTAIDGIFGRKMKFSGLIYVFITEKFK